MHKCNLTINRAEGELDRKLRGHAAFLWQRQPAPPPQVPPWTALQAPSPGAALMSPFRLPETFCLLI